jgi:1-acyl-sn-glycerol-3-phosphate acyltransferase
MRVRQKSTQAFFGSCSNEHERRMGSLVTYSRVASVVCPFVRSAYRLEVVGGAHAPKNGSLIVVANHESLLDPFVLAAAVSRELRFLAKAELWSRRPVAWLMDSLGGIRVERGRGDLDALAAARGALEQGSAVAIFPQGAVRAPGPWYRGAAKLALVTGAPVLPVRLIGTARALSPGHFGFPSLRAIVGEPIEVDVERPTIVGARHLTERLRGTVDSLS